MQTDGHTGSAILMPYKIPSRGIKNKVAGLNFDKQKFFNMLCFLLMVNMCLFQNKLKNSNSSHEMDLDFWNFFWKGTQHITELLKIDSHCVVILKGKTLVLYCKTLNICSVNISQLNQNGILAYINFGAHDILVL